MFPPSSFNGDLDAAGVVIGGEKFRPELLIEKNGSPDYITVAYGINDWACFERDFVDKRSREFYERVSALYPDDVVVASDTVVALDDEILGKPTSRDDAVNMLKRLSGREHTVYTGVSIISKDASERFVAATKVEFYELDDELIEWYISTNEPFDKAGAYGIQGKGSVLAKRIDGDYFTVMGLPSAEIYRALKKFQILPE